MGAAGVVEAPPKRERTPSINLNLLQSQLGGACPVAPFC